LTLNYHFFDYKYNIQGFSSDLFSTPHICYIILATIFTVVFGIIFRKTSHKKIDVFIKVLSIVMVLFETTKISWESYYDITTGHGFNYFGLLPLYTCSLFIYSMLLAGWAKGKVKRTCLSFITTISMLSGFIGMIYCNGLNFYPFWTFGAFYSLFFHFIMFFTGFFLLITGYVKLEWKDIYIALIPMLFLAVVAIPVNYAIRSDYMLIYEAGGVPLMDKLAEVMAGAGIRFLFTIIMLASYMILSAVVVGLSKLIYKLFSKKSPQTEAE